MTTTTALLARLMSQVHIKASPPPKNLSESRQILAALQKFGEVVTFRNLKYDVFNKTANGERPIVAIFESSDAAQRAIASSPITVTLSRPPSAPTNSSLSPPPPNPNSTSTSTSTSNTEPTTLTCTIEQSRHNHEISLKRNPFHSAYKIDKETPIYEDMTSPETAVPLQELGDVLQRPKPLIRQNVKENIWVKNARMGANSLMELWREGMANAEIEKMKRDREEERSATTGLRRVSLVNRRRERSRAAARGEGEGETWVDWRGR